jgi:sigma-B regulation protein RsbU (phosphoserine phosphatase)
VLLLEENGRTLVARAASGLEAEVYQGVRVPIGSGFAGRVAALGAPVVFSPTDGAPGAPAVPSPDAVRFVLGVPLTVDGRLLGVLHVGLRSQRRFTDDDIELLELVASTIATATQARMLSVERAAAQLLERSLMPAALPQCDGLDLAARYVPAERAVGGTGTTSLHCPPASCGW